MADQASLRGAAAGRSNGNGYGNGNGNGNGNGLVGRVQEFGNDVFTLGELQVRLVAIDAKEATSRATLSLAAAAAGLVVVLGAVPVALLGVADLLAWALNIRAGWAMLLTAAVAAAAAGLVAFLGARRAASSLQTFRRSGDEFTRNLAWVRTVLLNSGRPVSKRQV